MIQAVNDGYLLETGAGKKHYDDFDAMTRDLAVELQPKKCPVVPIETRAPWAFNDEVGE